MDKVYCIKKLYISDEGRPDYNITPEFVVETYKTKESRDKAWNKLVHDHNNMIQDVYEIDLNDLSYEEYYYYDWNDHMLIFYDKFEPTSHYDYFEKSEETLYE